jgi:pimeloyl-ACP methyl ester carboxylesterase
VTEAANLTSVMGLVCLSVLFPVPTEAASRFAKMPCPPERSAGLGAVECGVLTVPQDRARPGSPELRLVVVVLKASAPERRPDPVVFLSGGPGESALAAVDRWIQHPLRARRDIVLFDQRGTGMSGALCPELGREAFRTLARDLTADADVREQARLAGRCRQQILAGGHDPFAYSTRAAADDLDDLRQALGVTTWNLVAVSYGTRLALTAMQQHPGGIRSAVLFSPLGPESDFYGDFAGNFMHELERLSTDCQRDPACQRGMGGTTVKGLLLDLLAELGKRSWVVEIGPGDRFIVNSQDLLFIVNELVATSLRSILPAFLRDWRRGRLHSLRVLLELYSKAGVDMGLYYAVQCPEELALSSRGDSPPAAGHVELRSIGLVGAIHAACDGWIPATVDLRYGQPIDSAVPTLLLSGERDPRAPPRVAALVARHLSRGFLFELPGVGHDTMDDDAAARVAGLFVEDPLRRPDGSSLAVRGATKPIAGAVSRSGIRELGKKLRASRSLLWLAAPLLVTASTLILWPIGFLVGRRRRRAAPPKAAPPLPWCLHPMIARLSLGSASLLVWVFSVGLVAAVTRLLASQQVLLILVGLPAGDAWLFLLPKAIALLGFVGAAIGVASWRRARWSRWQRLHFTLALASLASFVAYLGAAQLF